MPSHLLGNAASLAECEALLELSRTGHHGGATSNGMGLPHNGNRGPGDRAPSGPGASLSQEAGLPGTSRINNGYLTSQHLATMAYMRDAGLPSYAHGPPAFGFPDGAPLSSYGASMFTKAEGGRQGLSLGDASMGPGSDGARGGMPFGNGDIKGNVEERRGSGGDLRNVPMEAAILHRMRFSSESSHFPPPPPSQLSHHGHANAGLGLGGGHMFAGRFGYTPPGDALAANGASR
jgi:hypothetical protein